MKAFAIVVPDNELSMAGYEELIKSYASFGHEDGIEMHEAISLDRVKSISGGNGLVWNYPWEGQVTDLKSGLIKSAYPTKVKEKRISCFLSHWYLWHKCKSLNETILILEHDARLVKKLPTDRTFRNCNYDIIGINDPAMSTRKAKMYHDKIQENANFFQPVPVIDDFNIPQGLAGNSAYVMKPAGATKMLDLAEEFGMWPNDALMCRQLVHHLGVTRNYYSRIQGLRSTTTL